MIPQFVDHPLFTGDWSRDRATIAFWKDFRGQLLLPCYSTDIAAAWMVVEKMEEEHTQGVLRIVGLNIGYRVSFTDVRYENRYDDEDFSLAYFVNEGIADTLPLAICRAALKAIV
jgi:hypothetical protein